MESKKGNPVLMNYKHSKNAKEFKDKARKEKLQQGRDARADKVRMRRNIAEDTVERNQPLKERNVNSNQIVRGYNDACDRKIEDKRKQKMLEWKAKRDRERKIEAKKYKDGQFVVKHIKYSPASYLAASQLSGKSKDEEMLQKESLKISNRPVTRSYAKKTEQSKTTAKIAKVTEKMTTRQKKEKNFAVVVKNSSKGASKGAKMRSKEKVKANENTAKENPEKTGLVFNFTNSANEKMEFKNPVAQKLMKETEENIKDCNGDASSLGCVKAISSSNLITCETSSVSAGGKSPRKTPKKLPQSSNKSDKFTQRLQEEIEGTEIAIKFVSEEVESPKNVIIAPPGKTPKRHLPKHLLENVPGGEGFTPRRIKSTAHFKKVVEQEKQKLINLNSSWNSILSNDQFTEEVSGKIRTVIGQSQLLMDQRFKQFHGLIDVHQSKVADKDATASDLQGFWDMIYFQIEDVHKKFSDLEKLRENDWKEEKKAKRTIEKKKPIQEKSKMTSKDASQAKQSAVRKFKLAMKAKMQAAKSEDFDDVKIITGQRKSSENKHQVAIEDSDVASALQANSDSSDSDQSRTRSGSSRTDISLDSLEDEPKQVVDLPDRSATRSRRKSARLNGTASESFCSVFSAISLNATHGDHLETTTDTKVGGLCEENTENELIDEVIEKKTPFKNRAIRCKTPSARKSAIPLPESSRRRSTRKTPSKYRTPFAEKNALNSIDLKPQDVACNLFHDDDNTREPRSQNEEEFSFAKYLRPSTSEDKETEEDFQDLSTTKQVISKMISNKKIPDSLLDSSISEQQMQTPLI